jgi:DNA invertase Pin-like site-specific DNA recombinase
MTDIAGQWYRVSGDEQDEANQRAGVTGHIARHGYTLGREYITHALSASKGQHLALLDEAIEDMRAGRINVLVVRHTDRIDRMEGLGDILKRVKAAGGRIESVTESWLEDFSSLPGKVMTSVTEFMNAEYTRKLSTNVKNAHDTIRARGAWVGSIPFGYQTEGETGRKFLTPHPVNGPLAAEVFQRMADGRTASSICAWLDTVAPQVIKKTGKASPWRAKRVIDMVKNPVYKGQHATHTGYEALVSPELWDAANAAMATRSYTLGTHETGGRRAVNGYSGAVYCACGEVLYHHQSTRNGQPVGTARYRCARGRRGIGGEAKCGNGGIPFEAANVAVDEMMLTRTIEHEYVMVTEGGDHERLAQIAALEAEETAAKKRKDRKAQREILDRIDELEAMLATPVITRAKRTGRRIADVWVEGTLADQRAFLAGRAPAERVTVWMVDGAVKVTVEDDGDANKWAEHPEMR